MAEYTVLLCDDNEVVHQSLGLYFEQEGIKAVSVYDGEAALEAFRTRHFDLIILDIMLPKMFGTDVCREIRKTSDIPILFLSAKGEEFDRVLGLELGADDYVTKPFSPREVVARIKSILRRSQKKSDGNLTLGLISVNTKSYKVSIGDEQIKMTPREVELLAFLINHRGEVLSRNAILDAVWGEDYYGDIRAVDTLIARVRGKIPEKAAEVEFKSIYGVGYMIDERK